MQLHPLAKILFLKLIRFEKVGLDLSKTEAKFGQKRLDLGKIVHLEKHPISYAICCYMY